MKKRILSLLTVIAMLIASSVSASAASVVSNGTNSSGKHVVEVLEPYNELLRGQYVPTEFLNLATDTYEAKIITLAASKGTYSAWYFATDTGSIKLSGDLTIAGTADVKTRSYSVTLYNKDTGAVVDTKTGNFTSDGTINITFSGLSSNKTYFFNFKNTSDTSTGSKKDISGTFTVSH